ncbi:MAG TPA: MASE1 domain-containing protein [Archangium sp.]|nr:MASE1 domain-containing protein [Archangium sp.]
MRAHFRLHLGVQFLSVFIAYVAAARLGLGLAAFSQGNVTLVWPPSGIAVAALLVWGFRMGPAVLLGAFVANLMTGSPLVSVLGITLGNTMEAVVAALLLRRAPDFQLSMGNLASIFRLILLAALGSTLLSALIGVASLWLGGILTPETAPAALKLWWVGDMLSVLVLSPLLLVWSERWPRRTSPARWVEAGALALFLYFTSMVVLADPLSLGLGRYALAFIIFLGLIWGALRFGQHGATASSALVAVMAIWSSLNHFAEPAQVKEDLGSRLLLLQLFIGVLSVTALVLGAMVTARERADAERRALVAQLREAVRARDEFLSVASHELKTPLTALTLQVEVLERQLCQGRMVSLSMEDAGKLLDRVHRQTVRLNRLIEALLDISRIATGRLELERMSVDLTDLTRELLERYQPELERNGCPAVLVAGDAGVQGLWDRLRLEQVFTNLLTNAMKFGAGHPIEVSVRRVDGHGELRVKDQGIGISPESQARIFERFERAVSSREFGGMGLGLFISRRIVQEHGGDIRVESAVGKGSTFVVQLPLEGTSASALS